MWIASSKMNGEAFFHRIESQSSNEVDHRGTRIDHIRTMVAQRAPQIQPVQSSQAPIVPAFCEALIPWPKGRNTVVPVHFFRHTLVRVECGYDIASAGLATNTHRVSPHSGLQTDERQEASTHEGVMASPALWGVPVSAVPQELGRVG